MESKIKNALKDGKAFIPFISAGDPDLNTTEEIILALEKAGSKVIEVGIPFSDPIADGPVIQEANIRALKAGTTIDKIFAMIKNVRLKTQIPIAFLTYLNPVFNYGYEKFINKCAEVGIEGLIIPDMPFEEQGEIKQYSAKMGIDLISFIAPTSKDRIKKIAKDSTGFIYTASSMGVTGIRKEITTNLKEMVQAAKTVCDTPCAVGFGINTKEQIEEIWKFAEGAIVGSAIVKIIEKHGKNAPKPVYEYVRTLIK